MSRGPAAAALIALLGACSQQTTTATAAPSAPAPAPVVAVAPPSASPVGRAIDVAAWPVAAAAPGALRDVLVRVQVLLDRANFGPGVIDGRNGGNLKKAVAAFEAAHGFTPDGVLDPEVWAALTRDTAPVTTDYVIARQDVEGPFVAAIPKDYEEMAKLPALAYSGPLEALAEKLHMDEALLAALNPGVDFGAAGTRIVVAAVAAPPLPAVARVDVDKARRQVRAYDAGGRLLAAYPATVGSTDMPTPAGEWAVRTVAFNPHWAYDPSRLNFGDRSAGKLDIKPGPNNPVGAVWIDLTKDTYGIHGAPDPRLVGKTASHGCVRLTNWDARRLAAAVKPGTKVVFLGEEAPAPTPA